MKAIIIQGAEKQEPNSSEASKPIAKALALKIGDQAVIHGKRSAVVTVTEVVNGDDFFVRVDGHTRSSIGSALNSTVEVRRLQTCPAGVRAVLTPAGKNDPTSLSEEDVKSILLGRVVAQGQIVACHYASTHDRQDQCLSLELAFTVTETKPSSIIKISKNTQIILSTETELPALNADYDRIGGLGDSQEKLRTYVATSLTSADLFNQLGVPKFRGILLIGPPGTGKTLAINAVTQETGVYRVMISPDRLLRDGFPQACIRLKEKVAEAKEHAPAIIVFENLDRLCNKLEGYASPELGQLTTTLANEFDNLGEAKVVVIASANNRETIDPILLTAGRFDKEIQFDPPDEQGRHEILEIFTRSMPMETDVNLKEIAERTHGFTGGDLAGLCADSVYENIRTSGKLRVNHHFPEQARRSLKVSMKDFTEALKTRKPSSGRQYIRETAKIPMNDVVGLDELKSTIKKEVIDPIQHRHLASEFGVKPPVGILLHGPPGTGKSYMARAIATELGWPVISKRAAELTSKYLGETQKNIDDLCNAAYANSPAVALLEEIDALASRRVEGTDSASRERSSVVNTLPESIDRITETKSQILLIFTTNRPDILDEALTRSGRVEAQYYVGPPDLDGREAIFRYYTKASTVHNLEFKRLAEQTDGFTPADIKWVCDQALRTTFSRTIAKLEGDDLADAQPVTVTMEDLLNSVQELKTRNTMRK